MGDSGHAQIHADFGAFALEVGLQLFDDVSLILFGYVVEVHADAEHVLGSQRSGFIHFLELFAGALADRAGIAFRDRFAFIDVTADGAYEFFHVLLLLFVMSHEAITVN